MFEVYWLSDEDNELTLGYYPTLDDANDAAEAMSDRHPRGYVLVREVDNL